MADTYEWKVTGITSYPEHEGLQDVVFSVSWVCNYSDGFCVMPSYGSTEVTYDASKPFVPYQNLTEAQIITWVHDALGTDGVTAEQDKCKAAYEATQNVSPTTFSASGNSLPWVVSNAVAEQIIELV